MKSLLIIFCCFCGVGAFAETGAQFTITTKDGLSVLNGQYDIPTENTCGLGPYKTVLVVSGSGFVYRDGKMGYSENEADYLYKYVNGIFLPDYGRVEADRLWCSKVEVRETPSNMAMRIGHREDNEELF